MSARNLLTRRLPDGADCRYCLGAGAVFVLAAVAVVYGVANDDTVTALGALLLLPAALLLAGIGLSGPNTDQG
jgi:hypothetical protein